MRKIYAYLCELLIIIDYLIDIAIISFLNQDSILKNNIKEYLNAR